MLGEEDDTAEDSADAFNEVAELEEFVERESALGGALIELASDNPSELVPMLFEEVLALVLEESIGLKLEESLGMEIELSPGMELEDVIGLELAEIIGLEFEIEDPMFPNIG